MAKPFHPERAADADAPLVRFFVEERSVSWALVVLILCASVWAYRTIPKRATPQYPAAVGTAVCRWPGASAEDVERFVTRRIERAISDVGHLQELHAPEYFRTQSISVDGVSIVSVEVDEDASDPQQLLIDVRTAVQSISDLPTGAGPPRVDVSGSPVVPYTLVVASPERGPVQRRLLAAAIRRGITSARAGRPPAEQAQRLSVVVAYAGGLNPASAAAMRDLIASYLDAEGLAHAAVRFEGPGHVGIDGTFTLDADALLERVQRIGDAELGLDQWAPDTWQPMVIADPGEIEHILEVHPADRYGYQQLSQFARQIADALRPEPAVARVQVSPDLGGAVYLETSADKLALYGISTQAIAGAISDGLGFRRTGNLEIGARQAAVETPPSPASPEALGDIIVALTDQGTPVYMRDLASISEVHDLSAPYRAYHTPLDMGGKPHRAVSVAVYATPRADLAAFSRAVEARLARLAVDLPDDLVLRPLLDHSEEVGNRIDLLTTAFFEAVILVLAVAFIGFREWRLAAVLAASVCITVAMTLVEMRLLGIELQEVSLAALIVALGLLVDDPVVALDAIQRRVRGGEPVTVAAWRGPAGLRRAIMFATLTNVAAYLPFLLLSGNVGSFVHSLPIVITCALVSSRFVSLSFVPMLATYVTSAAPAGEPAPADGEPGGRSDRWVATMLGRRRVVLAAALGLLALGGLLRQAVPSVFAPRDEHAVAYLDVFLPHDATLAETDRVVHQVERIVARTAQDAVGAGAPCPLRWMTSFLGSAGPRVWLSTVAFPDRPSSARVFLGFAGAAWGRQLAPALQTALSERLAGALVDYHLFGIAPVPYPIEIAVSGSGDHAQLLAIAQEVEDVLRDAPHAARVRNDWGQHRLVLRLAVNQGVAKLAGVTGSGVANAAAAGMDGAYLGFVPQGDDTVPVVLSLLPQERNDPTDLSSIGVETVGGKAAVPLAGVADQDYMLRPGMLRRRNYLDTVDVRAFAEPGWLASEVLDPLLPRLAEIADAIGPDFQLSIGGEHGAQQDSVRHIGMVLEISVLSIFVLLVFAFRGVLKPLVVFAAVPYAIVGAFAGLWVTGRPLGMMAWLAIASLAGIVVSHVIVLFDRIEALEREGVPLDPALVAAVRSRTRPVAVTVGATALALIPLAIHGGPFWRPFCFAEIGGLALATVAELALTPALYGLLVRDLGWLSWGSGPTPPGDEREPAA